MKLNSNIRQTFRVAKIELSSMFYSPVAWLVLIIFALLIGYDCLLYTSDAADD